MISLIIIGVVAGWLAGRFMHGSGFGFFGDLLVGVVGSFIGGYLFRFAGVKQEGTIWKLITATIGAIVLLFVIRLF